MTGRQKIQAALSPAGCAQFPVVICYEDIYIRDHWDQLTACPWWYSYSPDLQHQLAWRRDVIARTGQDWFVVTPCHSRTERQNLHVEERDGRVFRINRQTGQTDELIRPQVAGWALGTEVQSVHPEQVMDQFDQLDARLPLQEDFDVSQALADGRDDLAAALIDEFGGEKMPMARIASPLWGCYAIWGFEGMMTMVAERPDLVDYACHRLTQQTINSIRLKARLGAGVIWIEECLTDMVSAAVYEKLCLPYLQQLVAAMRREGVQSIEYYCGNPAGKWDLLFEIGADALALEESKKGFVIDIAEAAERAAGRCALLGNLDAMRLLAHGSEAELRREIARQIAAGRRNRNRFIMSLGSPVTPGTSANRVRLYTDLARELGSTATASTSIR